MDLVVTQDPIFLDPLKKEADWGEWVEIVIASDNRVCCGDVKDKGAACSPGERHSGSAEGSRINAKSGRYQGKSGKSDSFVGNGLFSIPPAGK